ncbi:MAG TPA: periplasmic heavy metal sensor [Candidatus Angelobacter sp.]|nr:periplasmic heavy metal sensor [Candidatus Angelobacter sp.]
MKTLFLKVIALVMLCGLMAAAQDQTSPDPARHIQRHIAALSKSLSLTPAQQQQATTLLTDVLNAGKALHQQMQAAHESLKAAVQKNDTAGIDQATGTIGALQGQMMAIHAKAMAAFRQTLTPDQQSKLDAMNGHDGMFGPMHGFRGHGEAAGPPPADK